MTVVLKLGGSVVTEKDHPETVDDEALARAADGMAAALADGTVADLVVVHGGGSFGHHHASEHGVSRTAGSRDPEAAREIHAAMKRLNRAVTDALADRGVPAVPVHPFSAAHRDADGNLHLRTDQVATMLAERFVPVLHGDVVAHRGQGVTILSGDELVVALARALAADRVGVCSTVPGVLDEDGSVVPEIRSYEAVADALGGSDATDVTGGMAAKVRALLDLGAPATVFDLDGLASFLGGDAPGTTIDADR